MTGASLHAEARETYLRRLPRPLLLGGSAIAGGQLFLYLSPRLSTEGALAGSLLLPLGVLGLFLLFVAWERRPLASYGFLLPRPLLAAVGTAGLLIAVETVVALEPGFGLGFVPVPSPTPLALVFTLAYVFLTALATAAVFLGYVLDRLMVPGRFAVALAVSAAMFALYATNLPILGVLGPVAAGTYLYSTAFPAFATGFVLGFYYYRSNRSLFGPFVLRAGTMLTATLVPIAALSTGWELTFLVALLGDAAVLMLLVAFVREPRHMARAYLGEARPSRRHSLRSRLHAGRRARDAAIAVGIAAIAVVGSLAGLELSLGTTHPILAIATGSMVPVFHRGTLVVIDHVPAAQIGVGTIVAYTSTCLPSPVVHRVVAISNGSGGPVYTTKGDANPSNDPCPVPYAAVLGKVVLVVPYLGFFILSPELTVGVAGLAVLAGILFWPRRGPRDSRQRVFG
jgi:signal peptidase I